MVEAAASAPSAEQPQVNNLRSWNLRQTPIVDAVKRVRDAVVNIHSERTVRPAGADDLFAGNSSQGRVNGMGTGILIDPRLHRYQSACRRGCLAHSC